MSDSPELDDDFNVADRLLCPDGSCTGLIGDDGRCKVCGRSQELPASPSASKVAESKTQAAEVSSEELFDDNRQLCSDGNCTGLIGDDGRCKVCGKSS